MCSWLIYKHAHALIGLRQLVLSRTIRLFRCTRDRYLWMITGLGFYWLVCFVALGSKGLIWNRDVGHPLALRHKGARAPFDWVEFVFVICQDKGLARMTRWFFATWVVWIWLAYKNHHMLSRYNVIRQQDFIMAYLATKSQDITPLFFPHFCTILVHPALPTTLFSYPSWIAQVHSSTTLTQWKLRHKQSDTTFFLWIQRQMVLLPARQQSHPHRQLFAMTLSQHHPPTFRSPPLVSQQSEIHWNVSNTLHILLGLS